MADKRTCCRDIEYKISFATISVYRKPKKKVSAGFNCKAAQYTKGYTFIKLNHRTSLLKI